MLRQWKAVRWTVGPAGPLRLLAGGPRKARRRPPPTYEAEVKRALTRLWYFCDCMCGKRLVPAIRALLPVFQRWGDLSVGEEVQAQLLAVSAATADRLLRAERKRVQTGRGRSYTRSAAHLLAQIPLRTFDEWDRSLLGQVQADLVGHDGGLSQGDLAFTCTVTELSVGWSALEVLPNKARTWVCQALERIRSTLPFPITALGTDTGAEFVNHHLFSWCQQQAIGFSRCRPYRKNDNCYVEERNNSLVRRTAGYLRYDQPEELELLTEIYRLQMLLSNYFCPWMKLVGKSGRGARVYRRYDAPRTPCQRLLERPEVAESAKASLRATFESLNPAALKRELTGLQNRLYERASSKPAPVLPCIRGKDLVIRRRSD